MVSHGPLVIKFGGELLEDRSPLATVVAAIARVTTSRLARPPHYSSLVVVHGGGKEIDLALARAGIEKRQVDGLRVTDDATLDVVVDVLAGRVNTRFVAALVAAGVRAVGLTGADAGCVLCEPAPPYRAADGRVVDLGRVGIPVAASDRTLLRTLADNGYVPVVASIGVGRDGRLFNVNADTLAGYLAAHLGAGRLVIAGTTAGVLDGNGLTHAMLDLAGIERLVSSGTATAGMIAKLRTSEDAIAAGVGDVLILDGRDRAALEEAANGGVPALATRVANANRMTG